MLSSERFLDMICQKAELQCALTFSVSMVSQKYLKGKATRVFHAAFKITDFNTAAFFCEEIAVFVWIIALMEGTCLKGYENGSL